jgi:hypothetical protein
MRNQASGTRAKAVFNHGLDINQGPIKASQPKDITEDIKVVLHKATRDARLNLSTRAVHSKASMLTRNKVTKEATSREHINTSRHSLNTKARLNTKDKLTTKAGRPRPPNTHTQKYHNRFVEKRS